MENRSFFSHFLVIGTGTIINMFLGLLTTPIITRIVAPSEYGQLSIFNMYGAIAVMILCLGLDQAFVRYFYENDNIQYKSTLLSFCFGIPIAFAVISGIILLGFLYKGFLYFEFDFKISIILFVYIISLLSDRFVTLLLRVTYKSKIFSACIISSKLIYICAVFTWFYLVKKNYAVGLCFSITLSTLVPTVIGIFYTKQFWKSHPKVALNKFEIIKFSLPFILSMGLTTLFQTLDKISLNHYHSYVEVGIYSSAMSLVNIFAIIQSTFNAVWVPIRTEHYTKHPDDRNYFQLVNQLITVIMFFIGIHLIIFKDLLILLLGKKYALASHVLPFLIFNPIMFTISETTCIGIEYSKKSYLDIYVSVVSCLTNFIGNTILVPKYSCQGAAVSTGISYIIFWGMRTYISNKYLTVDYKIKKFLILTMAVCVLAYHSTFCETNVMTVILYLICITLLFIMYRNSVRYVHTCFIKKFNR